MNQPLSIPFTKPYLTGLEKKFILEVLDKPQIHGDGDFTKKCHAVLEQITGSQKVFLTNSCTDALEMSALLADIKEGDEIIMPSYTFVSTANAFVLQGGIPVFIDIRPDTLNIDENKIEEAITPQTKAIVCVHYAGVSCEMDTINRIAKKHNLLVIEDAAQAIGSFYKNKPLGNVSDLGAFSFHGTKNITSAEGGALLVNDPNLVDRAEIVWVKGTNRKNFLLGKVSKYGWVDKGSSYLPSEIMAAFLYAQLQSLDEITTQRIKIWNSYHQKLEILEQQGKLRRPIVPKECDHNAHIYYILLPNHQQREALIQFLKEKGIQADSHYLPLHSSVGGQKFAKTHGVFSVTDRISDTVLRLPLYTALREQEIDYIIDALTECVNAF